MPDKRTSTLPGAGPAGASAQDLLVEFVRAVMRASDADGMSDLLRGNLLRQAHKSLNLADEAMSAALCGDEALLEHKLRCLVIAGLGRPALLELAVHRLRSLTACELHRQHASSTRGRAKLAQTLQAFMRRYGSP